MLHKPRQSQRLTRVGGAVSVWTTWNCNLSCEYCDQRLEKHGDMDEETLEATAKWINDNRIERLHLFGAEPLTNPYGFKYLLAKTRCAIYGVTTNGTLMNADLYDWMRLHGVKVALSLDGAKETQDRYRDGSYDAVMAHLPEWLELTDNVLMTFADPATSYKDITHIKSLGFKGAFLNFLHPFGLGYDEDALEVIEDEYRRIVKDLHNPPDFSVNDFTKTAQIIRNVSMQGYTRGCGINRRGLGISPKGYIFPCHRGMELGEDFAIGSVWHGIDPVRERRIRRQVSAIPEKCVECPVGCMPCPVVTYRAHDEFGINPPDWYCAAFKKRIKIVKELSKPPATAIPVKPIQRNRNPPKL